MKSRNYLLFSLLGVTTLSSCGCSSIWRPELEGFIFKMSFQKAATWCNKALLTSKVETKDVEGNIISANETKFYFESKKGSPLYYHLVSKVNDKDVNYSYLNRRMYKDLESDTYKYIETKDDKTTSNNTTEDYLVEHIEPFFFTSDDNGFKGGGFYRGDDLKTMGNLQVYMYLDEVENKLIYNYIKQPIGHIISTMLYKVNSYGLLTSEEVTNEEPDVKTSTISIDIKYNDDAIYDVNNFDLK